MNLQANPVMALAAALQPDVGDVDENRTLVEMERAAKLENRERFLADQLRQNLVQEFTASRQAVDRDDLERLLDAGRGAIHATRAGRAAGLEESKRAPLEAELMKSLGLASAAGSDDEKEEAPMKTSSAAPDFVNYAEVDRRARAHLFALRKKSLAQQRFYPEAAAPVPPPARQAPAPQPARQAPAARKRSAPELVNATLAGYADQPEDPITEAYLEEMTPGWQDRAQRGGIAGAIGGLLGALAGGVAQRGVAPALGRGNGRIANVARKLHQMRAPLAGILGGMGAAGAGAYGALTTPNSLMGYDPATGEELPAETRDRAAEIAAALDPDKQPMNYNFGVSGDFRGLARQPAVGYAADIDASIREDDLLAQVLGGMQ